jgi:hypothetical protein
MDPRFRGDDFAVTSRSLLSAFLLSPYLIIPNSLPTFLNTLTA